MDPANTVILVQSQKRSLLIPFMLLFILFFYRPKMRRSDMSEFGVPI